MYIYAVIIIHNGRFRFLPSISSLKTIVRMDRWLSWGQLYMWNGSQTVWSSSGHCVSVTNYTSYHAMSLIMYLWLIIPLTNLHSSFFSHHDHSFITLQLPWPSNDVPGMQVVFCPYHLAPMALSNWGFARGLIVYKWGWSTGENLKWIEGGRLQANTWV